MASGTKKKKHKCSCGRSFRHAISLKRHQNVTGCEPAAPSAQDEVVESPTQAAATPAAQPAKPLESPAACNEIVITPELVSNWQQQTGFQKRPVVDSLPPRPQKPSVDWNALAQTGREFCGFLGEVKTGSVLASKKLFKVLSQVALVIGAVLLSAWILFNSVSLSSRDSVNSSRRAQLAAQHIVADFLQNARLNQYHRARQLLAPGARKTVSETQLQTMMNSLPLESTPTHYKTEIQGNTARVVLDRDGLKEVYSLVHSDSGWGLSSVAVANS